MSVERDTRLKGRFSNAGRLFVHASQSKPHYRKLKSGPPSGVPRSAIPIIEYLKNFDDMPLILKKWSAKECQVDRQT